MAGGLVRVRLGDDTTSGLAHIVQQYLEQDLAEFARKRRLAARLRGRIAMTASDHDVTVTLAFGGGEIVVFDGERLPVDASIAGPHASLVRLLQGETNPLIEHLRGRLRVRARFARLFLPMRLHRLVRLDPGGSRGA
ncbi:MAG: hypothetical protein IT386_05350 [Deltaproteobacteria bacterium]|nr:hypothetical protein [Deltaproteobacteria bacterium]